MQNINTEMWGGNKTFASGAHLIPLAVVVRETPVVPAVYSNHRTAVSK